MVNVINSLVGLGQLDKGIEEVKRFLKTFPRDFSLFNEMGTLYYLKEDYDKCTCQNAGPGCGGVLCDLNGADQWCAHLTMKKLKTGESTMICADDCMDWHEYLPGETFEADISITYNSYLGETVIQRNERGILRGPTG